MWLQRYNLEVDCLAHPKNCLASTTSALYFTAVWCFHTNLDYCCAQLCKRLKSGELVLKKSFEDAPCILSLRDIEEAQWFTKLMKVAIRERSVVFEPL